jgi:hypothetical protein
MPLSRLRNPTERPHGRDAYVRQQQKLARQALVVGELGTACAALRALVPEDFSDARSAAQLLEVIRGSFPAPPQRLDAAVGLVLLDPQPPAR